MKNKKILWLIATLIILQALVLIPLNIAFSKRYKGYNLTILHTNDIHSHLEKFPGLALKIKKIKEDKAKNSEPVLLLDSGDFIIGTLYQFLTKTLSPELTLMDKLGYDATTLGNHEFEWGPKALAKIIDAARKKEYGSTVPIIASNIRFDFSDPRDNDLKKLYDAGIIKPYLIKNLSSGLKVGIIGLLGKRAEQEAPQASPVKFNHAGNYIQHLVNIVKSKGTNLIICLSHSGLYEDKKLAKAVKGIDVIVAGHCHTALFKPVKVNNTLIVEAGSYTKYLGKLEVCVDEGEVFLVNYQLIPINDTLPKDKAITRIINNYKTLIDKKILNPIGLSFNSPLAKTGFDLVGGTNKIAETNLGNLIADSIRYAIDLYQPENPVDFVFQPTGFIRGNIYTGMVKTSDAFRVVPLGTGYYMKQPGYPLTSFYITPREIKRILEISTYLALKRGGEYFLQVSGLKFWYNPSKPIFRKITKIERWDYSAQKYVSLDTSDNRTLYKVGASITLVKLFPLIKRYIPWIDIVPKDKKGNRIFPDSPAGRTKILVDRDTSLSGVQELKEWQALIKYLSHFPDLNGDSIPDLPLRYAKPQGRINKLSGRRMDYETQKKSPLMGMGAALIFPSFGHIYAREWYPKGLKFLLLELGSIFLLSQKSTKDIGLLALTSFKIWECKDAIRAVEDYNKKLARKYDIELSANKNKISIGISCRF